MIVVTDTSVVLNLCCLGHEALLAGLFGEVIAPPIVAEEFQRLANSDPRFMGLVFPPFIRLVSPGPDLPALASNRKLHAGEIAALSLAVRQPTGIVLMDESAGRAAATTLGLRCIGILGILIQAKRTDRLAAVGPLLDQLESKAGFWIGPALRQKVLGLVNE